MPLSQNIDELIEKASQERSNSPEKAQSMLEKAAQLSHDSHYIKGEALSLRNLGSINIALGNYAISIENLELSLILFQSLNDKEMQANTLSLLGQCYSFIGDYPKALQCHLQSLNLAEEIGEDAIKSKVLNNIGGCYYSMNEFESSKKYYLQSLEIKKKLDENKSLGLCYTNLASLEVALKNYEKANVYILKAIKIKSSFEDKGSLAFSYCILGLIKKETGQYDEALKIFQKVLSIYLKLNNSLMLSETYAHIAGTYLKINEADKALEALNDGMKYVNQINAVRMTTEFYLLYSKAYELRGDYQAALENYKIHDELKTNELNEKIAERIKSLEIIHKVETTQKQAEIERLRNIELAEANEKLKELNQERSDFLEIVAHDLKNPLANIVLSVSSIKRNAGSISETVLTQRLNKVEHSSKRMQEIIDNLLNLNNIENGKLKLNFKELDITDVINLTIREFENSIERKNQKLIFENNLSDSGIKADENVLKEILENLLSNAIKYSPLEGSIVIKTFNDENNIVVQFIDNGPGVKEEELPSLFKKFSHLSNKPTGGETSTGLGLSIVEKLVKLLNGDITHQNLPEGGSCFTVTFYQ
ncbi:MAG: tetratricopeptide repeat-containing sensor histidine kinase [Bacteroidetes bacterium]|nr:tetratricopeptide repeat-containing sensor histidine kinase [Bacteroidota bacterium]